MIAARLMEQQEAQHPAPPTQGMSSQGAAYQPPVGRRECPPVRAAIEADPVFSQWFSFGTLTEAATA